MVGMRKTLELQKANFVRTKPSPSATASTVGFVDGIIQGRLNGWFFDRLSPYRRLVVATNDRHGRQWSALADRYRADVHQRGHGDGHYGFSFPPIELDESSPVIVFGVEPIIELPQPLVGRKGPGPLPRVFTIGSYTLCIDGRAPGSAISGWAVDRAQPQLRRRLRLLVDGRTTGEQRATLYRAEIANGACDGYNGFIFPPPERARRRAALADVGMDKLFPFRF